MQPLAGWAAMARLLELTPKTGHFHRACGQNAMRPGRYWGFGEDGSLLEQPQL